MREQLARLLEFQDDPWVNIQVLPFSVGQHTAMMGSFTLLRFDSDPDLFYAESYDQGHMTTNPPVIKERSVGYARLQATALPLSPPRGLGDRDRSRDGGTLWEPVMTSRVQSGASPRTAARTAATA